jgi:hypothetical protein
MCRPRTVSTGVAFGGLSLSLATGQPVSDVKWRSVYRQGKPWDARSEREGVFGVLDISGPPVMCHPAAGGLSMGGGGSSRNPWGNTMPQTPCLLAAADDTVWLLILQTGHKQDTEGLSN